MGPGQSPWSMIMLSGLLRIGIVTAVEGIVWAEGCMVPLGKSPLGRGAAEDMVVVILFLGPNGR